MTFFFFFFFLNEDKTPQNYVIEDQLIDDERQTIIKRLHERANNRIRIPKHPVVDERYLDKLKHKIFTKHM